MNGGKLTIYSQHKILYNTMYCDDIVIYNTRYAKGLDTCKIHE